MIGIGRNGRSAWPVRAVDLEIHPERGEVSRLTLPPAAVALAQLQEGAAPLANAWIVARHLSLESTRIVPSELLAQHERLFVARISLESRAGGAAQLGDVVCEEFTEGATAVVSSTAIRFGDSVVAMGLSLTGHGRLERSESGEKRVTLERATFRAHAPRVLSRRQFEAGRVSLQEGLHAAAIAAVNALHATTNVFLPRRSA